MKMKIDTVRPVTIIAFTLIVAFIAWEGGFFVGEFRQAQEDASHGPNCVTVDTD